MNDNNEPDIIINGNICTISQAMTIRVALETFSMNLESQGIKEDETWRKIRNNYLDRIREIHKYY